jgi:hypothetical protein
MNAWQASPGKPRFTKRSATDIANSGMPAKVGMVLTAHKTVVEAQRDKEVSA